VSCKQRERKTKWKESGIVKKLGDLRKEQVRLEGERVGERAAR